MTHKIEELRASGHLGTTELLLLSDVEDNWNVFLLELDEVLLDEEAGLTFEAGEAVLSGEGEEAFALFVQELEELAADIEAAAAHSAEQAHNTYTSSRTIVLALLIVAVAIGMGVAGYLSWSISKGTKRIAETLRSLESGEITSLEGASGPSPRETSRPTSSPRPSAWRSRRTTKHGWALARSSQPCSRKPAALPAQPNSSAVPPTRWRRRPGRFRQRLPR